MINIVYSQTVLVNSVADIFCNASLWGKCFLAAGEGFFIFFKMIFLQF